MRLFTLLIALGCLMLQIPVVAQNSKPISPFGKIEKADMELKMCDFDPNADAMVLFEFGDLYFDYNSNIVLEVHKRIKIFTAKGAAEEAIIDISQEGRQYEYISDIKAQTINLVNDSITFTPVAKNVIYKNTLDKTNKKQVIVFPDVKAGSVIEYRYKRRIISHSDIPSWSFQSSIPVRYSEFDTAIPSLMSFNTREHIDRPFAKENHTYLKVSARDNVYKNERAMQNVPSLQPEPYMSSLVDNLQYITIQPAAFSRSPIDNLEADSNKTWQRVNDMKFLKSVLLVQDDVTVPNEKLSDTLSLIEDQDKKIAYLFNSVRKAVKWNQYNSWPEAYDVKQAWKNRSGTANEINYILYYFLKKGGIKSSLILVSTREHGKVNPKYPFLSQFNKVAVYVPVDSAHYYILDATSNDNLYNEIPENLLNSYGFVLNKDSKQAKLILLERAEPVKNIILVNATITDRAKIDGTAQISSIGYLSNNIVNAYNKIGKEKYVENLKDRDNNITVKKFSIGNLKVDSLPLIQDVEFTQNLTSSDDKYIYFNPNLFTPVRDNPFLAENRTSDIDFRYRSYLAFNGLYKIPAGYKTEVLPVSISLVMPDKSISFKRIIAEHEGSITARYIIDFKKSFFLKEDYTAIYNFYKKMYQYLNEQIVLAKI